MNEVIRKEVQNKANDVMEWAREERRKLNDKYKNELGLDGHTQEYKNITVEMSKRLQNLKEEYNIN